MDVQVKQEPPSAMEEEVGGDVLADVLASGVKMETEEIDESMSALLMDDNGETAQQATALIHSAFANAVNYKKPVGGVERGSLALCNGHQMRCVRLGKKGRAYWVCRRIASNGCHAKAVSEGGHDELTEKHPHNHAPMQPYTRLSIGLGSGSGLASKPKKSPTPPTTPSRILVKRTRVPYRGLLETCDGYRMRSAYATKTGVVYWQCAKQSTLKCSGAATSGLDVKNLVQTREHNHRKEEGNSSPLKAPTQNLYIRPYKRRLPMDHTRMMHAAVMDRAAKQNEPTTSSAALNIPPRKRGRPRKNVPDRTPCQGAIAMCNGYRMRARYRKKGGLIYWRCVKQCHAQCPATALSGPGGEYLQQVRRHNHPRAEAEESQNDADAVVVPPPAEPTDHNYALPKPPSTAQVGPSELVASLFATGQPGGSSSRQESPSQGPLRQTGSGYVSRNKTTPSCGKMATCNGYPMRATYIASTKGTIYWQCTKQSSQKCIATAVSGMDGAELIEKRPHNHPPMGLFTRTIHMVTKNASNSHRIPRSSERASRKYAEPSAAQASHINRTGRKRKYVVNYALLHSGGIFSTSTAAPVAVDGTKADHHGQEARAEVKSEAGSSPSPVVDSSAGGIHEDVSQADVDEMVQAIKTQATRKRSPEKTDKTSRFAILRCGMYVNANGFPLRCMNVTPKGVSYWACRFYGKDRCRGTAVSDLDGKYFTHRQPHNHGPLPEGCDVPEFFPKGRKKIMPPNGATQSTTLNATLNDATSVNEADASCSSSHMQPQTLDDILKSISASSEPVTIQVSAGPQQDAPEYKAWVPDTSFAALELEQEDIIILSDDDE